MEISDNFLHQYGPTPITHSVGHELEGPLTHEDFSLALRQTKVGKSLGNDGFNVAYYKSYSDVLARPFMHAFNTLSTPDPPHNTLLEAHISDIPKPEKDLTSVTNFTIKY